MGAVAWVLIGAGVGAVFVLLARRPGPAAAHRWLALGLVIAAGLYVLFAVLHGRPAWAGLELAGTAGYGVVAWRGLVRGWPWLAAGWALHPAWDAGLHLWGAGAAAAPQWYVTGCMGFDVAVAGAITVEAARARARAAA